MNSDTEPKRALESIPPDEMLTLIGFLEGHIGQDEAASRLRAARERRAALRGAQR